MMPESACLIFTTHITISPIIDIFTTCNRNYLPFCFYPHGEYPTFAMPIQKSSSATDVHTHFSIQISFCGERRPVWVVARFFTAQTYPQKDRSVILPLNPPPVRGTWDCCAIRLRRATTGVGRRSFFYSSAGKSGWWSFPRGGVGGLGAKR